MDSLAKKPDISQNKCPPGRKNDPINTDRPNTGRVIKIELTNDGQFVDRCQLTDALDELISKQTMETQPFGPNWRQGALELPRLTVLYVHGWKNDANSEDLEYFKKLIEALTDIHKSKKQVVGIYIAWNAAWHLGVIDDLSFWSKENVADRIAESGTVTKIVSAIGALRHTTLDPADQFIAIGHSFGARLLFGATSQALIYETEKAHPGQPGGIYKITKSPADAIILLNPAFEASIYAALDDVTRTDESFGSDQPPLLVSLSSESDWATTYAFPSGQLIGGRSGPLEQTTLGNWEPFQSHVLRDASTEDLCRAGLGSGKPAPSISERFEWKGMCLVRRSENDRCPDPKNDRCRHSQPYNPFLIAKVQSTIIDGHSDIWNEHFRDWLTHFIAALEVRHEQTIGTTR